MIPDFLICGVQKAGTSSLRAFLSQHPDIFMPVQEVHYYDWNYDKGKNWYYGFFKDAKKGQMVGEKSTDYVYVSSAADRIYKDNPDVKLIFMLRNPVERAHSHYRMDFSTMKSNKSFEDVIYSNRDMIERGLYDKQLERFYKLFPSSQIFCIVSEEFKKNKKEILKQVLNFLGVDSSFSFYDLHDRNVSITTKNYMVRTLLKFHDRFFGNINNPFLKKIFSGIRNLLFVYSKDNTVKNYSVDSLLYDFYSGSNRKVEMLIGRSISEWGPKTEPLAISDSKKNVTVVVTHYNDERLFKCLNSLLIQTRKPDNVIIADGGSKLLFQLAIQSYIKPYSYFKFKVFPGRCIDTRRQVIDDIVDKTDIIAWVDSDEVAFSDWLEKLVKPIEQSSLVSFTGGIVIPVNCYPLLSVVEKKDRVDESYIAMGNSAWSTNVFKKIGNFDSSNISSIPDKSRVRGSFHVSDDFDINIRAVDNGFKGKIVNAYTFHNQSHINSFVDMLQYLYGQYVRTSMAYFKHKKNADKFVKASKNFSHPIEFFLLFVKILALVKGWKEWKKIDT